MTDRLIDARGMRCPWPVLRLARALREAEEGDQITIVADDTIAPREIKAFADEHGLSLCAVSTEIGDGFRMVKPLAKSLKNMVDTLGFEPRTR